MPAELPDAHENRPQECGAGSVAGGRAYGTIVLMVADLVPA